MSVIGLHHTAIPIPVGNETKAREFYGGLLGFTEVPKPLKLRGDGGLWFQIADGRQLHLQSDAQFHPLLHPHPAFACEDLDAVAKAFTAAGFAPRWDERWDGVRRFFLSDPFRNRLEFLDAKAVGL